MTRSTFDDNILSHPKFVKAGEDAASLWIRSVIYCNRHDTDGLVEADVVPAFTSKPPKIVAALVERLVRFRLWDVVEGGWRVHDFHDWNWTAEQREAHRREVSAKRSAAGKAGNAKRWESRNGSHDSPACDDNAIANGSQTDRKAVASDRNTESQTHRPSPSPTPSPNPSGEETTLPSAGAAESGGVGGTTRMRARKLPSPSEPLPFTITEALEAVAGASKGRFVVPRGGEFDPKLLRPLTSQIREMPDLDAWARVGRWLASWNRTDAIVSAHWLAKNRDAFAKARAWEAGGGSRLFDDDAPTAEDEDRERLAREWRAKHYPSHMQRPT